MPTDTHEPPTVTALGHAIQDLAYARAQELPCAEALLRRALRCYAAWVRRETAPQRVGPVQEVAP